MTELSPLTPKAALSNPSEVRRAAAKAGEAAIVHSSIATRADSVVRTVGSPEISGSSQSPAAPRTRRGRVGPLPVRVPSRQLHSGGGADLDPLVTDVQVMVASASLPAPPAAS